MLAWRMPIFISRNILEVRFPIIGRSMLQERGRGNWQTIQDTYRLIICARSYTQRKGCKSTGRATNTKRLVGVFGERRSQKNTDGLTMILEKYFRQISRGTTWLSL